MAEKFIKLTGKVKKVESVKGTDRLILENIKFEDADQLFRIKKCANNEEAVEITVRPIQDSLSGME